MLLLQGDFCNPAIIGSIFSKKSLSSQYPAWYLYYLLYADCPLDLLEVLEDQELCLFVCFLLITDIYNEI